MNKKATPTEIKGNALMVSQDGQAGFLPDEEMAELLTPPRVKLLQKMSRDLEENDELKAGKFYIESSGLMADEIEFVPVGTKMEYLTFTDDLKIDQRFANQAEAQSALGQDWWKSKNAQLFMLVNGEPMPIQMTFHGSAFSAFRKFMQAAKHTRRDLWGSKYKMTVEKRDGEKGTFFVPKISFPKAVDQDEYEFAKSVATELAPYLAVKPLEPIQRSANADNDQDQAVPF